MSEQLDVKDIGGDLIDIAYDLHFMGRELHKAGYVELAAEIEAASEACAAAGRSALKTFGFPGKPSPSAPRSANPMPRDS
jgi:hypothetical protein